MASKEKINRFLERVIEANVLAVIFCLPFSKSLVEICVTVSIVFFIVKCFYLPGSFKAGRSVLIALSAFFLFNAVSLYNSQFLNLSLPALVSKVAKWVVFFLAVSSVAKDRAALRRVFFTMLASAALILFDAFWQQFITGKDFLHFPNGYPVFKFHARKTGGMSFPTASFPYPNDFASWINVYLFTFLALGIFDLKGRGDRVFRIVVIALCVVLAFFLFLTTSNGALLGAFVSSCLIVLVSIRKFIIPVTAILLVVILAVSFVPFLREYVTKGILDKALSINDRMNMWETGWRIYKERPVLGNGVNTFFEHYKSFRTDEDKGKGSYAHNCLLQMASDIGIFGLLSFLSLCVLVIFNNIRRALRSISLFGNSLVFGTALGAIAFLVHSFFDTNLYSLNLAALFWTFLGITEGAGKSLEEHR